MFLYIAPPATRIRRGPTKPRLSAPRPGGVLLSVSASLHHTWCSPNNTILGYCSTGSACESCRYMGSLITPWRLRLVRAPAERRGFCMAWGLYGGGTNRTGKPSLYCQDFALFSCDRTAHYWGPARKTRNKRGVGPFCLRKPRNARDM